MKSRQKLFIGLGVIAAVVIVLVVLILASPTTSNYQANQQAALKNDRQPAPSAVVSDLASVSQATLNTVGTGSANVMPKKVSAPALKNNGLPEVYYQGAEYCPYCATERWAVAVALDKFGSFSGLGITHSSTTDVYANTKTLSFYGSSFKSPYISFVPVEQYTNQPDNNGGYTTLQNPSAAQNALFNKYDNPPYVSSQSATGIPFIDFGGKSVISGATYSPSVLSGLSATQIASQLNNPNSKVAQGVDGAANTIIAAICQVTNNQPSSTCTSQIQTIEKQL